MGGTARDESSWYPAWGRLRAHERCHTDCPVVVVETGVRELSDPREVAGCRLPLVCPCECWTCKKAWVGDDMPVVRDGEVVRHP